MIVNDRAEVFVFDAYREAKNFLELDKPAQARADWHKDIRNDREASSFFKGPLRSSTGFGVEVAAIVARVYVDCFEAQECTVGPASREVQGLQKCAKALESRLGGAVGWVIADANSSEFREPLRRLAQNPSALPERRAGRKPLNQRKQFVLTLAEAVYDLTSTFHTGLLTVATVRGWENTCDRQVRDILNPDARAVIAASVAAKRSAAQFSERASTAVIEQARRATKPGNLPRVDNRTDSEKVAEALKLFESLSDRTASTVLVASVMSLGSEFGIGPAEQLG